MDLVVTVPAGLWTAWIAEGDAAGAPETGTEWGFYLGGPKPPINPGERLYIVALGKLRGFAPVTRVVRDAGRWVICRKGRAQPITIEEKIKGFRGFRHAWWNREQERPFPEWKKP